MPVADARIPRWDIRVTSGQAVEISQRWFDRDAKEPYDLTNREVRIWLGGTLSPDVDDLTGAIEIAPTINGEYATFNWNAGTTDRVIRTTLDGRVVTAGWEKPSPSARPSNSGDANVFVNDGVVSTYVSVHIDAPGGGGGGGGVPAGGTTGQALVKESDDDYAVGWATAAGAADWGDIGGTLGDQTDLAAALNAKADGTDLDNLDTTYWHEYTDPDEARVGSAKIEVWVPVPSTLPDPTNAAVGDKVIRPQPGIAQVLVHDGDAYATAGGRVFVGPEPAGYTPADGDQWIDPDNGVQYAWWGSEWVTIGGEAPEPSVPGKVTGLTATPGDGQVALEWSAPATGGSPITDYVIERAPDDEGSPGSYSTITDGTSTDTEYLDEDVTNGDTYWYRVSAVNAVGTGDPSDAEDATPTGTPPAPPLLTNTAEGGTDGVDVTTGNSGDLSGDAWTAVTGDPVYTDDSPIKGSMSIFCDTPSVAQTVNWAFTSSTEVVARFYIKTSGATSSAEGRFCVFTNGPQFSFHLNNAIRVRENAGSGGATLWTSAIGLSTDTVYRVEISVNAGGDSAGDIVLQVFAGDGDTPIGDFSNTFNDVSAGSAITGITLGRTSNSNSSAVMLDDIAVNIGTLEMIGPS